MEAVDRNGAGAHLEVYRRTVGWRPVCLAVGDRMYMLSEVAIA